MSDNIEDIDFFSLEPVVGGKKQRRSMQQVRLAAIQQRQSELITEHARRWKHRRDEAQRDLRQGFHVYKAAKMVQRANEELKRKVQMGSCTHDFVRTFPNGKPDCGRGCHGPVEKMESRMPPMLIRCFGGCMHVQEKGHLHHHAEGIQLNCDACKQQRQATTQCEHALRVGDSNGYKTEQCQKCGYFACALNMT